VNPHHCNARSGELCCTLHDGHRGTHYDSTRDRPFGKPMVMCRRCGLVTEEPCEHNALGSTRCPAGVNEFVVGGAA